MNEKAQLTNASGFSKDVESESVSTPVFVLFSSTTCKACQQYYQIWDSLQSQMHDVKFVVYVSQNTDSDSEILTRFGIRSFPTMLLFEAGKPTSTFITGTPSRYEIKEQLEEALW